MRFRSCTRNGQPVLVGTTSIEKSERLSELLKKKGLKQHVVLNAKFHEREAEYVAQAGRKGMVTIATNMAGRGTDILLGGNPEFMAKQELVKKGSRSNLRVAQGKIEGPQEDGTTSIFYYNGNEYTVPTDKWAQVFSGYKEQTDKEHDEVTAVGGLPYSWNRTPRVAPHRQPASRTRRPARRSRLLALLSRAGR